MRHRALAAVSAAAIVVTLAGPAAALETTARISLPYYLDSGVGNLFPLDGQRFGLGVDVGFAPGWSLGLETDLLNKDWGGGQAYTLAVAPLLLRYTAAWPGDVPVRPFITVGAGAAFMALLGGAQGPQVGLGPSLATGVGLDLPAGVQLSLEARQDHVNAITDLGVGLGLGLRFGPEPGRPEALESHGTPMVVAGQPDQPSAPAPAPAPSPTPMVMATPPAPAAPPSPPEGSEGGLRQAPPPAPVVRPRLPHGTLLRVGKVLGRAGTRVKLLLDDLPYRVEAGDVLVVYYEQRLPIKIAKVRILAVDSTARTATGQVLASTETIRGGYLVGTL